MGKRQYFHTLYGDADSGQHPHAASGMTGISVNLFDGTSVMEKLTVGDTEGDFPDTTTDFEHIFDVSSSSLWNASKRFVYLRGKVLMDTAVQTQLRTKLPHEGVDTDPQYHCIGTYANSIANAPSHIVIPINSSGKCNLWWSATTGVNTASGGTYLSVVGFM